MTEDFLRWFARWVDPNIGRVEQGVQCAAAWAAWRARATLHPLERLKQVTAERDQARAQYEALQERARKLHPIDLHDPQLDTADPYTRLFLLAEYWQRQAKEARACLDDECDRTDSLLTILGLECDPCRSEGGSLIPRKVITLMAEAGHPPRFSERDCELLGNGLAYIIREYPDKAEHARALLERMKPANVRGNADPTAPRTPE